MKYEEKKEKLSVVGYEREEEYSTNTSSNPLNEKEELDYLSDRAKTSIYDKRPFRN